MYDMNEVFDVVDVYYVPTDLPLQINVTSYYTALYYPHTNEIFITCYEDEFLKALSEEREKARIQSISPEIAEPHQMLYTSDRTLRIAFSSHTSKEELLKQITEYVLQNRMPIIFEMHPEPWSPHVFRDPQDFIEFLNENLDEILQEDY